MQLGFVMSLVFAIIIAIFALNNGEEVTIDFLFTTNEVSQALVILISTAFGAVMVAIFGLVRQIKLSLKVKEQGKKIKTLQEEKDELLIQLEGKAVEECKDTSETPTLKDNQQQVNTKKTDDNKLENKQEVQKKEEIDTDLEKELENELQKEKKEEQ